MHKDRQSTHVEWRMSAFLLHRQSLLHAYIDPATTTLEQFEIGIGFETYHRQCLHLAKSAYIHKYTAQPTHRGGLGSRESHAGLMDESTDERWRWRCKSKRHSNVNRLSDNRAFHHVHRISFHPRLHLYRLSWDLRDSRSQLRPWH